MANKRLSLTLATCVALLGAAESRAACVIERAVYKPLGGYGQMQPNQYELLHTVKKIEVNQSGLVLIIRNNALKAAHEFGFAFSNGYGRNHLIYSGPDKYKEDKEGDASDDAYGPGSPILYFNTQLKSAEAPIKPGEAAPEYLIMPEIGVKFWYMGKDGRKFIPSDGMWKLSACR